MNGFNERVHAYIPAKYYHYLKEYFGERGKRAFYTRCSTMEPKEEEEWRKEPSETGLS